MALTGGIDRHELRPLNYHDKPGQQARGSHRLSSASLNVDGAQAGFVYYWGRHPSRDRGGAQLQRFVNDGWQIVGPNDPERKCKETSLNYSELGLDGYQAHGDLILLRMTEERYRERQQFKALQENGDADAATEDYLDKGRAYEAEYGTRADGPIYYRGTGHGSHG